MKRATLVAKDGEESEPVTDDGAIAGYPSATMFLVSVVSVVAVVAVEVGHRICVPRVPSRCA